MSASRRVSWHAGIPLAVQMATGDAHCLKEAVKMCANELTGDETKRGMLRHLSQEPTLQGLRELCELTEKMVHASCPPRSPFGLKLAAVLQAVQDFAPNLDVMIQQQPWMAGCAWGSVRFIIQALVNEFRAIAGLAMGIRYVQKGLERHLLNVNLYSSSPRVLCAISTVLAYVLCYLITVQKFAGKPAWRRKISAAFFLFAKVQRISVELEGHERALEREMRAAEVEMRLEREKTRQLRLDQQTWHDWLLQYRVTARPRPPPAPETCQWVITAPEYRRWETLGHTVPLWIWGKAGCGKSVMATYLVETATTPVVLYFAFQSSRDRQAKVLEEFTATLVLALLEEAHVVEHAAFPEVLQRALSWIRSTKASAQSLTSGLLLLLESLLRLLPSFTLVVDGLDECATALKYDYGNGNTLLSWLHNRASHPGVPTGRIILLSRPGVFDDEYLQSSPCLLMTEEVIKSDIVVYAISRIEQARAKQADLSLLKTPILSKISDHCQGVFLWAKFFMDEIIDAPNLNEMQKRLESVPFALEEYYKQQLDARRARLPPRERDIQHSLFRLLVATYIPLQIEAVNELLAWDAKSDSLDEGARLIDPRGSIVQYCQPFVTIINDEVEFTHLTAKDFLLCSVVQQEESDAFILGKCLSKMSQEEYRAWTYAARVLRENLSPSGAMDNGPDEATTRLKKSVTYKYASLHWQDHLFALTQITDELLAKLIQFLTGNQFVTWSETLFQLRSAASIGAHVQIKTELVQWSQRLPAEQKASIADADFLVRPYEAIRVVFLQQGQDVLLPFLPLVRLGAYFNVGGQTSAERQRAYAYKQTVAQGYEKILGARNPMTLRAKTEVLKEYFYQKRFNRAEEGLAEVAGIQYEVLGDTTIDYFLTLQLLATAQFSLTKFRESIATFREAAEGFRRLAGPEDIKTLVTEMAIGWSRERVNEPEEAYQTYTRLLATWQPIAGSIHPFTLMLQTSIGSVCRRLGRPAEAEEALLPALSARELVFSLKSIYCIDTAIQLAALYYVDEQYNAALEVLDKFVKPENLTHEFERSCQDKHIRALIDFARGAFNRPRASLQRLLNEAGSEHNNRELLGVRITQADALRSREKFDEARMVFSDLVRPRSHDLPSRLIFPKPTIQPLSPIFPITLTDEPELPAHLALAEQALRLVLQAREAEADALLQQNGLEWRRKRDFWVMQGGPFTDTAHICGLRQVEGQFQLVEAED